MSNFEAIWQFKSMKATWKAIRDGLKKADARDCLDYLEFDLLSEQKIKNLRKDVIGGAYTPTAPDLFELAKERGAFRVMSILTAEDSLVFRHLVDSIYRTAQKEEPVGAFFAQGQPTVPLGPQLKSLTGLGSDFYESAWHLWIRYHQYRTKTLLNAIHQILVVTDVTNYFESIQHDLLLEYLAPLGLPRKTIGLLGKLLERFKPESGHSPTPRVGLPVDQHDCSRALAHIFLFEHDRRMIKQVGKNNYVRWMDDQNIGVRSPTEARILIRGLTLSLSQQRLVLNSGKTKFLTPEAVAEHFHLDTNERLDEIDKALKAKSPDFLELRYLLTDVWEEALQLEGEGNWDKILKRFYGVAGRLRMPFLKQRAHDDLITHPLLAHRIFEYFSALSDFERLLQIFSNLVDEGESLYENVEAAFFENILLSNIPSASRSAFRKLTQSWLSNQSLGSGRPYSRGIAALCLYWLGDRRSIPSIRRALVEDATSYPATTTRALVAVYIAMAPEKANDALKICGRFANREVASFSRFVQEIRSNKNLQCTLPRVSQRKPFSTQIGIFEARTWIRLEIMQLSKSAAIQAWLKSQHAYISKQQLGDCEQRVFNRWSSKF